MMETIKKRWLLGVVFLFQAVIPIALLVELFIKHKAPSLPAFVLVLGILYLAFALKKVKEKIKAMKDGSFKIIATELNYLVPFLVVAVLIYLTEHLFVGFYKWCILIVASIAVGSIFKVVEFEINKTYIYNQKLLAIAKEQVDLEKVKEQLKSSLDD